MSIIVQYQKIVLAAILKRNNFFRNVSSVIDKQYNKRLDRRRPCFEEKLTAGSNL